MLGLLLSCSLPVFKSDEGRREPGKERLYRIIMSTSIQVIWGLRCKRVISRENEHLPPGMVEKTWLKAVNDRLEMDYLMTRKKFGRKAQKPQRVQQTWSRVLKDEQQLPRNWTGAAGVLVGIGPSEGR
ncbi:hypothetical protein IW261DRAFT_1628625 [Armillaria novae-zelandiae]|uniref:Uncharacterized protein n=1 Tax=Armillaria novae-zelandiae TaxID=153914 RepID=A0AA39UA97_9AGAR|nr:hypothetical protein IW261DRAFT_1628625 [Armillaria novae-zelandiae]